MLKIGDLFDLVESKGVTSNHGGCNEQRRISMKEACPHCKGMLVSLETFTTSVPPFTKSAVVRFMCFCDLFLIALPASCVSTSIFSF
jgi:hypothetical protein